MALLEPYSKPEVSDTAGALALRARFTRLVNALGSSPNLVNDYRQGEPSEAVADVASTDALLVTHGSTQVPTPGEDCEPMHRRADASLGPSDESALVALGRMSATLSPTERQGITLTLRIDPTVRQHLV